MKLTRSFTDKQAKKTIKYEARVLRDAIKPQSSYQNMDTYNVEIEMWF